jgi:hypothetical protein
LKTILPTTNDFGEHRTSQNLTERGKNKFFTAKKMRSSIPTRYILIGQSLIIIVLLALLYYSWTTGLDSVDEISLMSDSSVKFYGQANEDRLMLKYFTNRNGKILRKGVFVELGGK